MNLFPFPCKIFPAADPRWFAICNSVPLSVNQPKITPATYGWQAACQKMFRPKRAEGGPATPIVGSSCLQMDSRPGKGCHLATLRRAGPTRLKSTMHYELQKCIEDQA